MPLNMKSSRWPLSIFQRSSDLDRELFGVIALDAKGVHQSRLTVRHAANLLAGAARHESQPNG